MTTLKAKVSGSWVTIGGAGVGVPVGGATNAILTKASAVDYATTWTTTPILTGLTVNETTNPSILLFKSGAPAQSWYQRFHSNGSWMMGPTNDDNYALAGNASRQLTCADLGVSANLTVAGSIFNKNTVAYHGFVLTNSFANNVGNFGSATFTYISTGRVRMNYNRTFTVVTPMVCVFSTSNLVCVMTQGPTSCEFQLTDRAGVGLEGWVIIWIVGW